MKASIILAVLMVIPGLSKAYDVQYDPTENAVLEKQTEIQKKYEADLPPDDEPALFRGRDPDYQRTANPQHQERDKENDQNVFSQEMAQKDGYEPPPPQIIDHDNPLSSNRKYKPRFRVADPDKKKHHRISKSKRSTASVKSKHKSKKRY